MYFVSWWLYQNIWFDRFFNKRENKKISLPRNWNLSVRWLKEYRTESDWKLMSVDNAILDLANEYFPRLKPTGILETDVCESTLKTFVRASPPQNGLHCECWVSAATKRQLSTLYTPPLPLAYVRHLRFTTYLFPYYNNIPLRIATYSVCLITMDHQQTVG